METQGHQKGFTLVELLVVIAIIGILAALGLYGFTTAQKKARDTQRRNDLKELKQALEAYAGSHNGFYPLSTYNGNSDNSLNSGIFAGGCTGTTPGPLCSYLPDPSKIDDPTPDATTYFYQYNGQATGGDAYVLSATLEAEKVGSDQALWVVCSNGMTGIPASAARPTDSTCPL